MFLRKHRWLLEASDGQARQQGNEDATFCATPQCPCLRDLRWPLRLLCKDPPPVAIKEFPADVASLALKSSGIYEDGWVSTTAHCVLTQPGPCSLVVRGMLPLIDPEVRSSEIRITIDGQQVLQQMLTPGTFELTCPVVTSSGARRVDFLVSQAQRLPAPDTRTIGMHLTYLGFDAAIPVPDSTPR
jgi:hypothetical protein